MRTTEIVSYIKESKCELLLLGHSGSTSAHPTAREIAKLAKAARPELTIIYGGVFPTYHWREILGDGGEFDVIVRGEGEETCRQLVEAISLARPLNTVNGVAYREEGKVISTPPQRMIRDLDAYRIAWELVDFDRYSYWGGKKAVVVQFSRGCPHPCTYCGQRGFWTRWRHRTPEKFAKELAWLHRVHGVEVFNFADENPTSSKKVWRRFLEAMIAEKVDVTLVGSTRADDIVRDKNHLHLYRKAGVERFLMGMEHTDETILKKIRKGATTNTDREAIRLMRRHGMLSMATWVVGFEEETDRDYLKVLRMLLSYDPDQIQSLYVTPHRWTPLFPEISHRRVIQLDQRKWDYKHQVLATRYVPPWRVFLWVKLIEFIVQSRPKALWRLVSMKDHKLKHGHKWYYQMGRRVWFHEVFGFLFRDRRVRKGPSVAEFWGNNLEKEEALSRSLSNSQENGAATAAPFS
jgi:anaerobic magnesium-protoporphyrin IX monomethyl ester cyclase